MPKSLIQLKNIKWICSVPGRAQGGGGSKQMFELGLLKKIFDFYFIFSYISFRDKLYTSNLSLTIGGRQNDDFFNESKFFKNFMF